MGSSTVLRVVGMLLAFFGLFVTALAFLLGEAGSDGLVIIFPFVFGNVSGPMAVALTLLFFVIFITLSFLPWVLFRGRPEWRVCSPLDLNLETEEEGMDYIITVEVPNHIRRKLLIEGEEGILWLKSGADRGFMRSYSLPNGFEVDEFEYEYEGSYLVLKLKLRKKI